MRRHEWRARTSTGGAARHTLCTTRQTPRPLTHACHQSRTLAASFLFLLSTIAHFCSVLCFMAAALAAAGSPSSSSILENSASTASRSGMVESCPFCTAMTPIAEFAPGPAPAAPGAPGAGALAIDARLPGAAVPAAGSLAVSGFFLKDRLNIFSRNAKSRQGGELQSEVLRGIPAAR